MSDVLAARSTRLPGEMTPVGLRLPIGLDFDEWMTVGKELTRYQTATSWALADWLFYGEWEYGRRYEEGLELTGLGYQTLADLKYVASRFDISRRHEELAIAHHREVAPLAPADQDVWLERAEAEGWSSKALRAAVVEAKPSSARRAVADGGDPRIVGDGVLDEQALARVRPTLEEVGRSLSAQGWHAELLVLEPEELDRLPGWKVVLAVVLDSDPTKQ